MQKAEHILSLLGQKAKERPDFVFQRFYRYLYHPGIYMKAMEQNARFNLSDLKDPIDSLIQQLKVERCDWNHPQQMELLKSAITILLQAIYQPSASPFCKNSLAQALTAIQSTASPSGWLIEMPSADLYQHVSPERFGLILKRKICDGRFLRCVQKFIQIHGWPMEWLNILLQELDQWMGKQKYNFSYIRYYDHIFLLMRAARADAQLWLQQIHQFMLNHFGLNDVDRCTRIHDFAKKGFRFADYEIKVVNHNQIGLFVSKPIVDARLRPYQQAGKPKAFSARIHLPIERMIDLYRKERIDFESFCSMAWNRHKRIRYFRYVHFYSLVKTIARKQNLSVKKVRKRYRAQLQRYLA